MLSNEFKPQPRAHVAYDYAKLNSNENPFGPSAKVRQAMIDGFDMGCRYPYQMMNLMETGDSADVAAVLGDRLRAWHDNTFIRLAPDLPEAR